VDKSLPNVLRIVNDAKPAVAITGLSLYDAIRSRKEFSIAFCNIKFVVTDANEIENKTYKWKEPAIDRNDIAFLQYSSGSTSAPKGVIVTHNNLLHNLSIIEEAMGLTEKSHTVFWLPPYHDMGLIGGILQALYTGYTSTLIPHLMFLQKPIRWLQAITRYQATASGGPNFAYDLCVRKIRPEQREQLDFSSLGSCI
jgi:acyl-CoA synthetase (AMP-forming)/AMP-acid ligase II